MQVTAEEVLNYLYIDYPEITEEAMQNIVVSVGEEGAALEDAVLTLLNGEEESTLEAVNYAGNAALFSKDFSEDIGVYQVQSMAYTVDGTAYEVSFAGCDMESVSFTVGEEEAQAQERQAEIETEVVTFDAEGNMTSQESIADAIEEASKEAAPSISLFSVAPQAKAASEVVVVLDAGHDDSHAGARANGLEEEDLTLKIAQYCKVALEQYSGVKVYMARTSGSCPYPGTSSGECNQKRVEYAKSVGADVYVSIHLNSAEASSASGAEVYYPNDNYLEWVGNEGEALASKVQDQLAALGLQDRGIKIRNSADGTTYPDGTLADYYGVIRNSKLNGFPGIIIEHAFLTNASDVSSFLSTEEGLKKLGEADARGIAEYFGLGKEAVQFTSGGLTAAAQEAHPNLIDVKLSGVSPADKVSKIEFAVWSEIGGQDDLVWYTGAAAENGT